MRLEPRFRQPALVLRTTCYLGLLGLAACGEMATLPVSAGTGPDPTLPEPNPTLIPTVKIAPASS